MISYTEWREKLAEFFRKYIVQNYPAVTTGVAFIHALWVMQRGFYKGDDAVIPGRAAATLSMMADLTLGLNNNDFMRQHGARVYPLFEAAIRGWISGAYYNAKFANQDGQPTAAQYDTIVDAQSCTRVYRELALAIVVLSTGRELTPEQAAEFRTELTALLETP